MHEAYRLAIKCWGFWLSRFKSNFWGLGFVAI